MKELKGFLISAVLVCLVLSSQSVAAGDKGAPAGKGSQNRVAPELFEFYDETLRLFKAVPVGGDITIGKEEMGALNYGRSIPAGPFSRDYTDKAAGDFSVRFDAPVDGNSLVIGFTPGAWLDSWALTRDFVLHFQLKSSVDLKKGRLALLDHRKKRAWYDLAGLRAEGNWQMAEVALGDFKPKAGFDFADGLAGCELHFPLSAGARIWLDEIYFVHNSSQEIIGVTEKPLSQRISEASQTKHARLSSRLQKRKGNVYLENTACIAEGENLTEANRRLTEYFLSEEAKVNFGTHFFFDRGMYVKLLLNYGRQGRFAAGRLSGEAEKALLELIWNAAKDADDIANARNSTWWLLGSENHDIHYKIRCLLSAQVLANHPDFKDRIYADTGTGNGYADDNPEWTGQGQWSDGKSYTPVDHYQAWVVFFREFLRERAKKGLFVEIRSNHYISAQIESVSILHTYCADEEVRKLAGMLLDLIWADYVQDSISGINGGAKTRSSVRTRMADFIIGLLGGPGARDLTYELPPIVWKLALKREGLGDFAYLSRRPGEEEDIWPRPKGGERAQMCGADSRLLRYSWVTPDYVLGTQMDHPATVHSHPSIVSRFNGVTFSASVSKPSYNFSGVYPYLVSKPEYNAHDRKGIAIRYWDFMYSSVQYRNVLITQQPRPMRVRHVSPKWFPTDHARAIGLDAGVYMEDADRIAEQQGWVFVQKGNAYVAVRPIMVDKASAEGRFLPIIEDSYEWNDEKNMIKMKDPYSPIIIEAGRKATHGSFGQFQDAVLSNPLRARALIAYEFDLIYRGAGPEAQELVFNTQSNALPTIGGKVVDYRYPNVFESPYILSKYNSGVVTIRRGSESLTLDFNRCERRYKKD